MHFNQTRPMLDDNFEGFSRILASQVFREALEGYNQILDH